MTPAEWTIIGNFLTAAAPYIVATGAAAVAWWKARRAKKAGAAAAAQGLTVAGMAAVVELLPADPRTAALKAAFRTMAQILGTQQGVLAPAVEQVEEILQQQGLGTTADEMTALARAARAIKAADDIQKKRNLLLPPALLLCVVGACLLLASACCPLGRVTTETVLGGAVAVEWPVPVRVEDVTTVEIDGRAISVARPLKIVESLDATVSSTIPMK